MGRPDASAERMVSVTKRYGLSVVLVLSALLVKLLVRPETLVGPVFLLAVLLSAWLGGMGPGLIAALVATLTTDYFFLPPKYTLRFNRAELPELLAFFVSADLSQFAVITDLEKKAKVMIVSKAVVPDISLIEPDQHEARKPRSRLRLFECKCGGGPCDVE